MMSKRTEKNPGTVWESEVLRLRRQLDDFVRPPIDKEAGDAVLLCPQVYGWVIRKMARTAGLTPMDEEKIH